MKKLTHDEKKKITYWRGRMQDKLHSFDGSFTQLQKELLEMANHIDLSKKDLVDSINDVRKSMMRLAISIERSPVVQDEVTVEISQSDSAMMIHGQGGNKK